jgi:hypothetical protein
LSREKNNEQGAKSDEESDRLTSGIARLYRRAIPAHAGAIPAHAGAIPAHAGAIPAHVGAVPAHVGAVPAHVGIAPAHVGIAPACVAIAAGYAGKARIMVEKVPIRAKIRAGAADSIEKNAIIAASRSCRETA